MVCWHFLMPENEVSRHLERFRGSPKCRTKLVGGFVNSPPSLCFTSSQGWPASVNCCASYHWLCCSGSEGWPASVNCCTSYHWLLQRFPAFRQGGWTGPEGEIFKLGAVSTPLYLFSSTAFFPPHSSNKGNTPGL